MIVKSSDSGQEAHTLITEELYQRMVENWRKSQSDGDHDPIPVVKLFTPDASATWLLTEINPDDPSIAFGLCDLGHGFPELGYVSLQELATIRGRLGLPVERDLHFKGQHPLSVYAYRARQAGRIEE